MSGFNRNPRASELRSFGLITGALTAGIFGLALPLLFHRAFPTWPWIAGTILMVWALVGPATLKPVYLVWMTIGQALGWVNTRIIMAVMFYLIIVPVGLLRRITAKDPMSRDWSAETKSYRKASSALEKKHVERPF